MGEDKLDFEEADSILFLKFPSFATLLRTVLYLVESHSKIKCFLC